MKRFLFPLVAAGIAFLAGSGAGLAVPVSSVSTNTTATAAYDPAPTVSAGVPVTLRIPAIGVTAAVEKVGTDADGRMDIPADYRNAGWFRLGVRPGETGNAVIDGHVNTPTLGPNIFSDLSSLVPGDMVEITDDAGQVWGFSVVTTERVPAHPFPVGRVFGTTSEKALNLITCDGTWDTATHEYDKRLVVFTRLTSYTPPASGPSR